MSTWTSIRDAVTNSAVQYGAEKAGITLPVTSRTVPASGPSVVVQASEFSTKYRAALILAAVLGVLVLIKMRK